MEKTQEKRGFNITLLVSIISLVISISSFLFNVRHSNRQEFLDWKHSKGWINIGIDARNMDRLTFKRVRRESDLPKWLSAKELKRLLGDGPIYFVQRYRCVLSNTSNVPLAIVRGEIDPASITNEKGEQVMTWVTGFEGHLIDTDQKTKLILPVSIAPGGSKTIYLDINIVIPKEIANKVTTLPLDVSISRDRASKIFENAGLRRLFGLLDSDSRDKVRTNLNFEIMFSAADGRTFSKSFFFTDFPETSDAGYSFDWSPTRVTATISDFNSI